MGPTESGKVRGIKCFEPECGNYGEPLRGRYTQVTQKIRFFESGDFPDSASPRRAAGFVQSRLARLSIEVAPGL
jgi:hypothetical protein